jgi:hypothetical protein
MSHDKSKYNDKNPEKELMFQSVPFTPKLKVKYQTNVGFSNINIQNEVQEPEYQTVSALKFISVTPNPKLPEKFNIEAEKNIRDRLDIQESSSSIDNSPIFIFGRVSLLNHH